MCVYPLLFKQAVKFTAEGSPLHTRFEEAFNSVQATIEHVNDAVRRNAEQQHTAGARRAVRP